jgi:hypothetical protein
MNAKVHDTIAVSLARLLFGQAIINLYSGFISAIPPEFLSKAWTMQRQVVFPTLWQSWSTRSIIHSLMPSWTIAEKRSYLLWFHSVSKRSMALSNATQLDLTRAPLLRSTSRTLESHVRFSPIFLEGVETHLGFWRV